jgi:hypothetical protein
MSAHGRSGTYTVTNTATGEQVTDCVVLRPEHDRAARAALYVYGTHCGDVALRDELHAWVLRLEGLGSWLGEDDEAQQAKGA